MDHQCVPWKCASKYITWSISCFVLLLSCFPEFEAPRFPQKLWITQLHAVQQLKSGKVMTRSECNTTWWGYIHNNTHFVALRRNYATPTKGAIFGAWNIKRVSCCSSCISLCSSQSFGRGCRARVTPSGLKDQPTCTYTCVYPDTPTPWTLYPHTVVLTKSQYKHKAPTHMIW